MFVIDGTTFYSAAKLVQWLCHILKNLQFKISDAPTLIYKYSQPTIDIIKSNNLTIQVNHINDPIHYLHEHYAILIINPIKMKTAIRPADIGNKNLANLSLSTKTHTSVAPTTTLPPTANTTTGSP